MTTATTLTALEGLNWVLQLHSLPTTTTPATTRLHFTTGPPALTRHTFHVHRSLATASHTLVSTSTFSTDDRSLIRTVSSRVSGRYGLIWIFPLPVVPPSWRTPFSLILTYLSSFSRSPTYIHYPFLHSSQARLTNHWQFGSAELNSG